MTAEAISAATSSRTDMACITVETTISHDHQADFYGLYLEAFGPLRERAAARHVLTGKEFFGEMSDPRILKYVAWDGDGRPEALSTLTRDLSTVPWISPEYFAARYPEHTARRAVYYWGFVLARPNRRRPFLFRQILTAIIDKLATERGVCAYDICGFNNETMRFGDQIEAVAHRFADVTVEKLDTQTYYGATFP